MSAEEHVYMRTHALSGPWFRLDINQEISSLRDQMVSGQDKRGVALVKEGGLRVVLTALISGATMEEHQAAGPTTVQVLSGRIEVRVGDEKLDLPAGGMVVFDRHVGHAVVAEEDSAILITIATDAGD